MWGYKEIGWSSETQKLSELFLLTTGYQAQMDKVEKLKKGLLRGFRRGFYSKNPHKTKTLTFIFDEWNVLSWATLKVNNFSCLIFQQGKNNISCKTNVNENQQELV